MIELTLTGVIQVIFLPLFVVAYSFYVYAQKSTSESPSGPNREFKSFQQTYLLPYFMALFSDWLQGPYVYKLYSYYGFQQREIAILYVVGFASSVTLGTATGPLADKFGRRKMSVIFCLMYAVCCLTKLSPSFHILLFGRVLGGISTSILFSVFESWYIHQHTIAWKYPIEWTSMTFSKSTFFNGLLAIIAGVVAQAGADWLHFGPVSPFVTAIPCLIVAAIWISVTWDENYGEQSMGWSKSCLEGYQTIIANPTILALGLVQSLFESNMYIFVFLWTPVLEIGHPPVGLTFSTFMMSIMIGSSLYSYLLSKDYSSEIILTYCCALMSVSMLVAALCTTPSMHNQLVMFTYLSFLVLEIAVGLYFPCISTLRGQAIPDNLRANIYNWFRVPMNILTCGGLIGMHHFEHPRANQIMFLICCALAALGFLIARKLQKMPKKLDEDNQIIC